MDTGDICPKASGSAWAARESQARECSKAQQNTIYYSCVYLSARCVSMYMLERTTFDNSDARNDGAHGGT